MARGARRGTDVDVDSRAFRRGLEDAIKNWAVKGEDDLKTAGQRIRNRAMQYSPVDTGRLRAGWQVEEGRDRQGFYVEVSNSVEYAAEVEKGNHKTPPAPMLIPAIAETLGMSGIGHAIEITREP